VDAHRSTGYVISPWIKKSSIDHGFHNTTSMLKTMELLLGVRKGCCFKTTGAALLGVALATPTTSS
jgi:hypothetical protein